MRYADNPDPVKAAQWLDFQVLLADLNHPENQIEIRDPETLLLAELRQAALQCARGVIGGETRRLSELRGRTHR